MQLPSSTTPAFELIQMSSFSTKAIELLQKPAFRTAAIGCTSPIGLGHFPHSPPSSFLRPLLCRSGDPAAALSVLVWWLSSPTPLPLQRSCRCSCRPALVVACSSSPVVGLSECTFAYCIVFVLVNEGNIINMGKIRFHFSSLSFLGF